MREDLMCFARILCLIAHYELGKDYYLENQLKNTYKFLLKMNDLHEVQKEIIRFMKNLNSIYPSDIKKEFVKMKERFMAFSPETGQGFRSCEVLAENQNAAARLADQAECP